MTSERINYGDDKATLEWHNSLKHSSRIAYRSIWKHFLEFTGLTGDQILADRKQDKEHKWEQKVLQFKEWMIKKGYSENSATTAANCVRGFFAFHYQKLEYRRSESQRLKGGRRKTEDYRLSLQDLKKMTDFANLEEKYIILAGKSFGFRAGDFLRITKGDLKPYLNSEPPISIGEFPTEKEDVKAFPFIDSDALPVIKAMVEKMEREGRTDPNERILTYKHILQLSRALQRVMKRAGIETGNKRVRFHILRKFLIDRLASFMSESKWKQIVGKKISEGAYVSPDTLREDYKRAMEETCFSKRLGDDDIEKIAKKQALLQIAKSLGYSEEELKRAFAKAKTTLGEIEALERMIAEKRHMEAEESAQDDCPDGEHCREFKQIVEGELLTSLRSGYQIVQRLMNGEYIISKKT